MSTPKKLPSLREIYVAERAGVDWWTPQPWIRPFVPNDGPQTKFGRWIFLPAHIRATNSCINKKTIAQNFELFHSSGANEQATPPSSE